MTMKILSIDRYWRRFFSIEIFDNFKVRVVSYGMNFRENDLIQEL